ncbi:MAG: protoheme IX farnesyltransferase [Thermoleophilia bacterium]|nr:protoheme IX farnesyltransferase [Thermoleophilia bacterium]
MSTGTAAAEVTAAPGLARDLVTLTKPRIISLLLVTTVCAMFVADRGVPNGWLIVGTIIGGYLSAGGANTINQFVDRDIDAVMDRTGRRPIVAGRISPGWALAYGCGLVVASVLVLGLLTTWLAAGLSLVGVALYVGLYTLWLKRTTIHNIVIGGAAGAVPPLVGWAAVTGEITFGSVLLFAIVFAWTPPHFWALALMLQKDYSQAGVPMLPVVYGEDATRRQVLLWTVVMLGITVLPFAAAEAGLVYLIAAVVLGAAFLGMAVRLWRGDTRRPWAAITFHFSLAYLAALFVVIALDASL